MIITFKEPFYFYHLISKNTNIYKYGGLVSPEYFYQNNLIDEYLKVVNKYRERLVKDFKIYPNINPKDLSAEQIHNGLNIIRHDNINGNNRIYFFKYLPYSNLGNNMRRILKNKIAYRIDIHNNSTINHIIKIDWGYWMSNSNNKRLSKKYYEQINEEEYFKYYNDNLNPLFATLNHISIIPKNYILPINILERVHIE